MRPSERLTLASVSRFNPRICKRCDSKAFLRASGLMSFNPRICKRCDRSIGQRRYNCWVSIHASVKDATSVYADDVPDSDVSIHASVKDATIRHTRDSEANEVSIHASVKDATRERDYLKFRPFEFQSTHL